jgi:hypothetical protein
LKSVNIRKICECWLLKKLSFKEIALRFDLTQALVQSIVKSVRASADTIKIIQEKEVGRERTSALIKSVAKKVVDNH